MAPNLQGVSQRLSPHGTDSFGVSLVRSDRCLPSATLGGCKTLGRRTGSVGRWLSDLPISGPNVESARPIPSAENKAARPAELRCDQLPLSPARTGPSAVGLAACFALHRIHSTCFHPAKRLIDPRNGSLNSAPSAAECLMLTRSRPSVQSAPIAGNFPAAEWDCVVFRS